MERYSSAVGLIVGLIVSLALWALIFAAIRFGLWPLAFAILAVGTLLFLADANAALRRSGL